MSKTISLKKAKKQNLNILIIDDNEQITQLISSFLDMSNHNCTVVNDGIEGLEQIKTNQFDSILLDLSMPEFDGYDILNTLEKDDPTQMHKIVILTASSISPYVIQKFRDLGVSACLQKPVDIDQLLSSINDTVN
ncbi:MAG TPA: response regulator [Nitrosopumilaceae archaeon]|jgi:two-component system OmpR family response regulator|nr:response regulator [Nitrosopumilaceae archaeon]